MNFHSCPGKKKYTQKTNQKKGQKKFQDFLHIYKKISPPASQPGRWSSQWWGVGGGFCPSSSSSGVPIPGEAGEHGSPEPSADAELGVPRIRGRHHLVGKAVLRAQGQLIRGLHAVVDLWEGQRKRGCQHRSFPLHGELSKPRTWHPSDPRVGHCTRIYNQL